MAGLSVLLLIAVGLIAWRLVERDAEPYRAAPPAPTEVQIDAAGAAATLRALEQAWHDGDRDVAGAQAWDGSTASGQLSAAATNIAGAHVKGLSLRYLDETGGLDADGTWPATVEVAWKYGGFDRRVARAEVAFSFNAVDDEVLISSVGGRNEITPLWLTGPLAIRRSSEVLVLAPSQEQAAHYERLAAKAVPTVRRVIERNWGGLVVEVPDGQAALEGALAAEAGYYAQIAAVTTSPDAENTPGAQAHIFLNPAVFDRLDRDGQDVVLAHEIVHVVTGAPASHAPTWLVEGFADYVALRDSTLPLSKTAAQIRNLVASEGVPDRLPGSADFDTGGSHLGAVYESAWLICQTLADRGGQDALVSFYESMGAGGDLEGALERWFGWSEVDLVAAWQERLSDLPA